MIVNGLVEMLATVYVIAAFKGSARVTAAATCSSDRRISDTWGISCLLVWVWLVG